MTTKPRPISEVLEKLKQRKKPPGTPPSDPQDTPRTAPGEPEEVPGDNTAPQAGKQPITDPGALEERTHGDVHLSMARIGQILLAAWGTAETVATVVRETFKRELPSEVVERLAVHMAITYQRLGGSFCVPGLRHPVLAAVEELPPASQDADRAATLTLGTKGTELYKLLLAEGITLSEFESWAIETGNAESISNVGSIPEDLAKRCLRARKTLLADLKKRREEFLRKEQNA